MFNHRYFLEFALSLTAYVASLIGSVYVLANAPDSTLVRTLVSLMPMLPAVAVCWVVLRQLRRMDEMQKKLQFEAMALAFAGTALVTFSYGFLENVGFPKMSMFFVWPLMAALWLVGTALGRRRYG